VALRENILLERELEDAKINAAIKPDFNLFDAFNVLDHNRNGSIAIKEMFMSLKEIGVYSSEDEVKLYVKRYDKNGDEKLKFSEFCDSMVPKDAYYASQLNRRSSNNVP
jgi:Ca2+-binding EF-hand superfamily protein